MNHFDKFAPISHSPSTSHHHHHHLYLDCAKCLSKQSKSTLKLTANNERVLLSISQEYACGAVGHIEIHVRPLKWYDWYVRILLIFKHQPGTNAQIQNDFPLQSNGEWVKNVHMLNWQRIGRRKNYIPKWMKERERKRELKHVAWSMQQEIVIIFQNNSCRLVSDVYDMDAL